MSKCCFERLGVDRRSSEREIKTAYRRLALATHPDKFPDPKDKEGATTAFRELHDAYEQAMQRAVQSPAARGARPNAAPKAPAPETAAETPRSTPKAPSSGKRKAKATRDDDADIRQTFNDVCDELDRASLEREKQSEINNIRVAAATWATNREECWNIVNKAYPFKSEVQKLADHFKTSIPCLSLFLEERASLRNDQLFARISARLREKARYIDENWPTRADHVKSLVVNDWISCNLEDLAKLVQDPMVAHAILQLEEEQMTAVHRRVEAGVVKNAKEIVRIFPDKEQIGEILRRYPVSFRPRIYALLPEDIKGGMEGMFDDKAAICAPKVGRSPPPPTSGHSGRAEKKTCRR